MKLSLEKYDKAKVLTALYSMSTVDLSKMGKYRPGGMFLGEAIVMLDEVGEKFSYIWGRPLMIDLTGTEVDLTVFKEHQPGVVGQMAFDHVFTCSTNSYHSWEIHVVSMMITAMYLKAYVDGHPISHPDNPLAKAFQDSSFNFDYHKRIQGSQSQYDQLVSFIGDSIKRTRSYSEEAFKTIVKILATQSKMLKDLNLSGVPSETPDDVKKLMSDVGVGL